MMYKCDKCGEEFEPDHDCIIMPKYEADVCSPFMEMIYRCGECADGCDD